ncbi:response regulator transcription factor [Echinicola shivajiensis]|uniref:response regulator transcription factor n=1 Tax=Echinicola shivajiensis TaxID=1035916 RepID=UPI001BFCACD3|nr:response regulator [Echinicola shivajiensis]
MKTLLDKKVFIVDDDPFWKAVMSRILVELGFKNITQFNSGRECLENMVLKPSLIFLDYQMEDTDGLEALPKIKSHFPETNVIFCTALEDLNVAINALELGSHEYLLKSRVSKAEVSRILNSID